MKKHTLITLDSSEGVSKETLRIVKTIENDSDITLPEMTAVRNAVEYRIALERRKKELKSR